MSLIPLYLSAFGPAVLGIILATVALRSWWLIRDGDGDQNWKDAAHIQARLGVAILIAASIEQILKFVPFPRVPSEKTDVFAPSWLTYLEVLPSISLIVLVLTLGFWQAFCFRLGRGAANGRRVAIGCIIACVVSDAVYVTWFYEPFSRWILKFVFSDGMSPNSP